MNNSNEPVSSQNLEGQETDQALSEASFSANFGSKALTVSGASILQKVALEAAQTKGVDFFGWKNSPEVKNNELTMDGKPATLEASQERWKAKLDGAYGERFLMTVAYIKAAVEKGVEVCLLQKQDEPGIPFDAKGWVVVSIGTYPMFHIAPWDLPMEKLEQAGLINLVVKGSEEDQRHAWKNTNKLQEFEMLLNWL